MTKSELRKRSRGILNHSKLGTYIKNQDHIDFLNMLIQRHPEADQKIGCGIEGFLVNLSPPYNSRCFFIKRTDGSLTDFSYIMCINGKPSPINQIKAACRTAVLHDITRAKLKVRFGADKCPITGEVLELQNTHIDHYDLTFKELFDKWIESKDPDTLYLKTNYTSQGMVFHTYFTDPVIAEDFRAFHNQNTHLRAVSRKANLSLLR